MNIEHISVSRVGTIEQCKYKYKLKYHLKTPSPIPEQIWFRYGKIVHKVIELYTKHKGMMNINDISKEVMTTENPLPYHYAQQLPKDLKQFMVLSKKIGTDAEIEVPFKKDLDAPHNKFVVGFMDMIIKRNDEYWILDFKTTKEGKFRKTMQTVVNDLQLMCYTWVVSEMYNVDPSKIKAGLYYLQGGSLISAKFSKQTLENVPKKLLKVYNEVMESNPDTVVGTVGDHCGLCEYKSLCSYFQNSPLNVL